MYEWYVLHLGVRIRIVPPMYMRKFAFRFSLDGTSQNMKHRWYCRTKSMLKTWWACTPKWQADARYICWRDRENGDKLLPPIFIWVRLASAENAYNRKTVLPWSWLIIYRTFRRSCSVPADVCQWLPRSTVNSSSSGCGKRRRRPKVQPRRREQRLMAVCAAEWRWKIVHSIRRFSMLRQNRKWQ